MAAQRSVVGEAAISTACSSASSRRSGRLHMQTAMSDLVDAWFPGSLWMPITDGDQQQCRFAPVQVRGEHRTPPAGGLRDVELQAASKSSSVPPFLRASQEPIARNSLRFHSCHGSSDGLARRNSAASQVLDENPFVYPHVKARPAALAGHC